jgi:hypothetical protein
MDGMGGMMDGRTDASLQAYKQPNLTGHMQALRQHGSVLHPFTGCIDWVNCINWVDGWNTLPTHWLTGEEGTSHMCRVIPF